jgi:hypothetical protein
MTAHSYFDREPTPDERAGMDWWNSLDKSERRHWFNLAKANSPAEAWAMFKRGERLYS